MVRIDDNCIDLITDESAFAEKCMGNADNPSAIAYWQGYIQALAFAQTSVNQCINDEDEHAEWISKDVFEPKMLWFELQSAKCSSCNTYLTTPYMFSFKHYNYCPNCGKEMEK